MTTQAAHQATQVPPSSTQRTAQVEQKEPADPTFEDLARRVDAAVSALDSLDGQARAVAEELKAAVEAVHRAGLVTIVRRMRSDDQARSLLFELVDDPTVHMLLSLHEIIRPDPATLAERALVAVRPQLHGHGGDVTLVRVAEGTAYVRLEGACNGCSMSAVTLRTLVEQALVDAVPSITGVEVLPNEASPALIPLESLLVGPGRGAGSDGAQREGWAKAAPAADVAPGTLRTFGLVESASGETAEVIVVNVDNRLSAYRNACAHEGLPLDGALLDTDAGTLTCPWHGFCYDATSGECLSAPGAQLEQLPLRVESGDIWVRVRT